MISNKNTQKNNILFIFRRNFELIAYQLMYWQKFVSYELNFVLFFYLRCVNLLKSEFVLADMEKHLKLKRVIDLQIASSFIEFYELYLYYCESYHQAFQSRILFLLFSVKAIYFYAFIDLNYDYLQTISFDKAYLLILIVVDCNFCIDLKIGKSWQFDCSFGFFFCCIFFHILLIYQSLHLCQTITIFFGLLLMSESISYVH